MKPLDHSECHADECVHSREKLYYEAKRREKAEAYTAKVPGATQFGGYAETVEASDDYPKEWLRRKVQLLEDELLEARAEAMRNGVTFPMQELRNVVGDALRLAAQKNEQYGDAWRKSGYMGNLGRIKTKTDRLDSLLWRDPDGNGHPLPANYTRDGETIVDTLLDLINLAGFMAVNWTEQNRWG